MLRCYLQKTACDCEIVCNLLHVFAYFLSFNGTWKFHVQYGVLYYSVHIMCRHSVPVRDEFLCMILRLCHYAGKLCLNLHLIYYHNWDQTGFQNLEEFNVNKFVRHQAEI